MNLVIALAVYGAFLSTILAIREIVQGLAEIRKEQRRVKISFGATGTAISKRIKKSYDLLEINVTNIGHRPIIITQMMLWIECEKHERLGTYIPFQRAKPPKFPVRLDDAEQFTVSFDMAPMAPDFPDDPCRYVYVSVTDTEGKEYKQRFNKWVLRLIRKGGRER
jgi:hypothetical protein